MSQLVPRPDRNALDRFGRFQHARRFDLSLIRSDKRDRQIQRYAALQDIAHAAQDAVDLPECAETVAVNQREALRLRNQIVVLHGNPRMWASGKHATTCAHVTALCREPDGKMKSAELARKLGQHS